MRVNYLLTDEATEDLDSIWNYIAADNPDAANRVEEAIFDACEILGEFPSLGAVRPEITRKPVRFWTVSRYRNFVIIYRSDITPIHVLKVVHGRQDLKTVVLANSYPVISTFL